jgi:RNA-binding protein
LDKKRIIELRGKAQSLKPTVYVGRGGVSEDIVIELDNQLKKNKLVKVKLLPSVEGDRNATGEKLAMSTQSVLIEVRGRTVVLAKDLTRVQIDHCLNID